MKDYPFETSGLSVRAKGVLQRLYANPRTIMVEAVTSEDDVRKLLENGKITRMGNCGLKTYQELCHHFGARPLDLLHNLLPRQRLGALFSETPHPEQCPTCGKRLK